ncbi:CRISPR-associated endonuclease Cas2 [Frigoriglobus tundricola]|uniref:CRISPR-associated endoribonuclease Cas2 n=1 Tax=Frigoriglobus tundricola TaxID=2774151 RepID=A0A6M5YY57_9BACT|nr:CRISPR-associated endonuclease Cas2 [Frigoriglobus tundricola]QJW98356.1 CRISPR-associated protein Cas2 [Frigoriglobus tundricola]
MDSYLVCYDISDPKRLRKVARTCEDFGYRKQLSVFLVRVSSTAIVRLRTRLYDIINRDEDQVLFIPLTESALQRMEAIGRATDAHDKHDAAITM